MTRTLALVALTFVALSAHAQAVRSVVVTDTPDGFTSSPPGDVPVGDARAVLLMWTDRDGWNLRSLSPGEVPSEVAARPFADLAVPFGLPNADRLVQTVRLISALSNRISAGANVLYTVSATVPSPDGPSPEAVAALAADPALAGLEATSDGERTQVETRFRFESVAAWSAWLARSETRARLDALLAGAERQRTALDVQPR